MRKVLLTFVAVVAALLSVGSTQGAARTWNNVGTDYNTTANWTGGVPGANDVGLFATAPTVQPNLSASLTNAGLRFSDGTSGYNLTSTGGAVLTLNGINTTGGSGTTTASASAIRNDNVTGTTTIDAPLNLAPSTGISTIFQEAADAGVLILNGAIGQTGTVSLSLKNGTIQLNNANTYSGGTTIDAAGTTVVVGNDTGLGSGTYTNNQTSTLQAGGGARTIANSVLLAGNMTVSGTNALTINGSFTSSGSNSRTLTVTNTGGLTLGGNVFLQEAAVTGRTFIVNGSTQVTMNGVVADGGTGPALLRYAGTSSLTLGASNTYSGGTQITVTGGSIIATADGALGSGNVSLTAANVTLTLQGASNNYISDTANLNIGFTDDVVNLNFSGTDTISGLTINGAQQNPGIYGSAASGAPNVRPEFFGTGTLTVIPEPATYMLFGLGLLACAQQFRRKKA